MQTTNMKTTILLTCLAAIVFLGGCGGFPTNWKKKHESLNVEHQNVLGQLEFEKSQRGTLTEQVSQGHQTISELQKRIAELNESPAMASGFGEGYNVSFDASAGTITVTLDTTVLFASGAATLKKATSAQLDHIRSVLRSRYAGKKIDVVGHTDSDPIRRTKGKWKDNWELSAQRALTVVRYLVKGGIAKNRIRAAGCGENRPVVSNATISGKAKNRRVEIVVYML